MNKKSVLGHHLMLHFVNFHHRNTFPVSTMHEVLAMHHVQTMLIFHHHFVMHFWDLSIRCNSRPNCDGLGPR